MGISKASSLNTTGSHGMVSHWRFDEGEGKFVEDIVTGIHDPIHYIFNDARYKPSSDPLWVDGIRGKALLFDGYSTWVERPAEHMFKPSTHLSIEAWVAPRSYEHGDQGRLSAIVNQHDREAKEGYILGMFRHGAWSFQIGTGGDWFEVWVENHPLPRSEWSYITAVFDGQQGEMSLYLNGKKVASKEIPQGISIRPSGKNLLIGKNNKGVQVRQVFTANMFNGIIDEVKIYERALSEQEITASYRSCLACFENEMAPQPDVRQRRSRYKDDRYRPQYHFIPPEHWMNEPHGPLYFNGQYHIFYQHNPQGPYWHQIHWGHAVSDDLVHWRDLPFALSPEKGEVDPDGCWSGSSAIDDEGVPVIFYAAGDHSKSPNQSVGLARSTFKEDGDNDLKHWIKHKEPVVIQEKGIGRFGEFRDPFVWKEEDTWYMLVTSGIPGQGGTALLYTSTDLIHWTYRNPLYVGDVKKYPKTGVVWELPVFLPLGKDKNGKQKHLFLINPWFGAPSPYYCKYIFYWIGTWDKEQYRFIPDDEEPQVIDVGEHFIGPSAMIDDKGRIILFTVIFGMSGEKAHDLGWFGNAGLPVILKWREDFKLGVEPIPELHSLREEKLAAFRDKTIDEANGLLAEVQGDMLEIMLELEPGTAEQYGIKVRTAPDGMEETSIYYDTTNSALLADRNKSSLDPDVEKGTEGGTLLLDGENLKLHIYMDRSMIEAYANGLKSLTTRVFPVRFDALGLKICGNETTVVKSMEVWRLRSAYNESFQMV